MSPEPSTFSQVIVSFLLLGSIFLLTYGGLWLCYGLGLLFLKITTKGKPESEQKGPNLFNEIQDKIHEK